MSTLFISYRRSDSKPQSLRLYDHLVREFGRDNVFIDIDSMPLGNDFPTVLDDVLNRCRIVLVVIGPTWLTVTDEADGTRRLYNPRDFVRQEVEAALQREILVVPVLVGGADFPEQRKLPESLRPLCFRHADKLGEDADFQKDADRLVTKLKRELAGEGPEEPLHKQAERPHDEHAAEIVGRDRAFPLIAEQAVTGNHLIVLTGPPGAGKTVTANEFARWYIPPAQHGHILTIDARRELYELSLAEAVGKAFPEEFYREHDGVPVTALPFRNLHHLAIELLVKHKATVILDAPGEASYPRDGTEELNLARRTAVELAAKSVLVIVTARDEMCWADQNPIHLQGLSPENALALLRREILRWDPTARSDQFADRVGGEAVLADLVKRGCPGELIAAARPAAASSAPAHGRPPGVLGRFAAWVRQGTELVLGDPVISRPTPPAQQSTGPGELFGICLVLLLISTASLMASYGTESPLWERMFYLLAADSKDVPLPSKEVQHKGGLCPGLLVELTRSLLIIIGMLLIPVGWCFRQEAAQLVPHPPWSQVGQRRLGLRSLFRLVFLSLAVYLAQQTVLHHLYTGPRNLWMCNGNPKLQNLLATNDKAKWLELQNKKPDEWDKMNEEPPHLGEPGYDDYWRQCLVPYRWYYGYSFVMLVLAAPTVLTICFYSVCSSLWNHLISQPRQIGELPDNTKPQEIDNRLRYYKETYVEDIDRYLILLLMVLNCLAFHLFWDLNNLTTDGLRATTELLIFAIGLWGLMFMALILTYQPLVKEARKRIPHGSMHDDFRRRYEAFKFFREAVSGSAFFWLCLLAGGIGALRYAYVYNFLVWNK